MFKPLRLIFKTAPGKASGTAPGEAPGISPDTSSKLNAKNFLNKIKETKFDKDQADQAKAAMSDILGKGYAYKLIKAEALVATEKITTSDPRDPNGLESAASRRLETDDIEAFLNLYGGEQYLGKIFRFGISRMQRDFLRKKQSFAKDKQKIERWKDIPASNPWSEILKYDTFEEAFDAGFYTEFDNSPEAIMEKGLSVIEYLNRNERLNRLRRQLKQAQKAPAETIKMPDETFKAAKPAKAKPQPSPVGETAPEPAPAPAPAPAPEPARAPEPAPPAAKPPPEKASERPPETPIGRAYWALTTLGVNIESADAFIVKVTEKYKDQAKFLKDVQPLFQNPNTKEYQENFLKLVIHPATREPLRYYDTNSLPLSPEAISHFSDNYSETAKNAIARLEVLRLALYGGLDLGGMTEEEQRKALIADKETAYPELREISKRQENISKKLKEYTGAMDRLRNGK